MKKLLLSAAAALLALGASAANPEDVRIYINPGHGSWTSGDRPCGTVKHGAYSPTDTADTTGFFESNTNLLKGYAMLEKLVEYGVPFDRTKNQDNENPARVGAALDLSQNIVMSHVKAGPFPPYTSEDGGVTWVKNPSTEYNRNLSEVAAEVEFNNFDVFISIHSNANNDGDIINYPLIIYRGTDAEEGNAGSKAIGQAVWPHLYGNGMPHQQWTATTTYSLTKMNIRGDQDFYSNYTKTWVSYETPDGYVYDTNDKFSEYVEATDTTPAYVKYYGYLGALKHGVPGFLAEGYFHTYQPARHRYMNDDVCYLEGETYAKGLNDYFGWGKTESYGAIYGIVRDKNNKFTDRYYTPKNASSDIYKPLNDVEVTLKNSEGNVVDTYTTDDEYNGVFVFNKLEPGEYTVELSHPEYFSDIYADTKATTEAAPLKITVTAAKTACPEAFLVDTAWVAPSIVYVNYPDSLAGKNFTLADEYNVEGSALNGLAEQLAGKTIRRTVLREGLLYVLAVDAEKNPTLMVLDTDDNSVKATISTAGCEGTHLNLSDIQVTADGYLIGCSKEWNQYSASEVYTTGDANHTKYGYGDVRGECWIYKWEKDENGIPTGEPVKWISTKGTGNWYRAIVGETFAWTGTSVEGMAILSAQTATATGIRTQLISVSQDDFGNTITTESFHQPFLDGAAASTSDTSLGETYNYVTSPLNDKNYLVVSAGDAPIYECEFTHTDKTNQLAKLSTDIVAANTPNVSFFKYAGKSLMVAPNVVDGKADGVKVIDITNGIQDATTIAINDATIEPIDVTYAAAHGELALTIDDASGITTDAEIELFLVANENVTKFTTAGVKQPVRKGEYAYDLAMEGSAGEYTLTFNVTGNAPDANVILTNKDTKEETIIPIGAVTKGENSIVVNIDDYNNEAEYNWAIEINSKAIYEATQIAAVSTRTKGDARGGVAFVSEPESDAFGRIVVSNGYSQGINIISPTFEIEGTYHTDKFTASNRSSSFRVCEDGGIIYIQDWADKTSGIWTFDPVTKELGNFFEGTRDNGGSFVNADGKAIGGGGTGMDFYGEGDDRFMLSYQEDYPYGNAGKANGGEIICRYNVGTAKTWGKAPDATFPTTSAKVNTNTNVEIIALEDGMFVSQVRTAGQSNTGYPAFIYSNYNDEILYNAGTSMSTNTGDGTLNASGSGMAISEDLSLFVFSGATEGIKVFNVTWNNNVPSFELLYTIPNSSDNEILNIDFDIAGNIHTYGRQNGYRAYAIPQEAPKATTAAKSELVLKGTISGVEDVTIEAIDEDAPVEYYNLQGVKVENPSNGIYIKVQGKKNSKVYIK